MLMVRLRDTPRASRSTLVVAAPPAASIAVATTSRAWASAAADKATSRSTLTIEWLSESSRSARVMVSRSSCNCSLTSGSVGALRPASSSRATIRWPASRTTRIAAAAECGSNTSAPSTAHTPRAQPSAISAIATSLPAPGQAACATAPDVKPISLGAAACMEDKAAASTSIAASRAEASA